MNFILIYERIKNKINRAYREYIFQKSIVCKHNDFTLVGNVILINRNIKLGKGVTIYPGCMFFVNGLIDIGNNVTIGNNTIIYSSANGGYL